MSLVEYSKYLKIISYFIVPLVVVFPFNLSPLNIIIFILMLYNIYLFLELYLDVLDKNGPGISKSIWKICSAIIVESIIILAYIFIYPDSTFWTTNSKMIITPKIFSLITSISYNLSLIIRNNAKRKYLIINILNILFFAFTISIFISNNNFYLPLYGETNITFKTFYGFLILFSWTCFKSLNLLIYPLIVFFSIFGLGKIYKVMGMKAIFIFLYFYILHIIQFYNNYLKEEEYKDFFNKFKSEFFSKNKNNSYRIENRISIQFILR